MVPSITLRVGATSGERSSVAYRGQIRVMCYSGRDVDWFSHRRVLEPIGHIPPAEFGAAYYRGQNAPAIDDGLM